MRYALRVSCVSSRCENLCHVLFLTLKCLQSISLFYITLFSLFYISCWNFQVFSCKTFGTWFLFLGNLTEKTSPLGKKNRTEYALLKAISFMIITRPSVKFHPPLHSLRNVSVMTSSQHITPSTSP